MAVSGVARAGIPGRRFYRCEPGGDGDSHGGLVSDISFLPHGARQRRQGPGGDAFLLWHLRHRSAPAAFVHVSILCVAGLSDRPVQVSRQHASSVDAARGHGPMGQHPRRIFPRHRVDGGVCRRGMADVVLARRDGCRSKGTVVEIEPVHSRRFRGNADQPAFPHPVVVSVSRHRKIRRYECHLGMAIAQFSHDGLSVFSDHRGDLLARCRPGKKKTRFDGAPCSLDLHRRRALLRAQHSPRGTDDGAVFFGLFDLGRDDQ